MNNKHIVLAADVVNIYLPLLSKSRLSIHSRNKQKSFIHKRVKMPSLGCLFRPFAELIQKKYLDHPPSKRIFKQRLLIKIDVFTRSNKCIIIKENSDAVTL